MLWLFQLSGSTEAINEPPATAGVVGNPSKIMDEVNTANEINWGTAADDRLHGIYKNRNPQNILPSVVWNNSCLPSSDTSGHPSQPRRAPC